MNELIKKLEEQLTDYKKLYELYQQEVKYYKEKNYDKISEIDKECLRVNEAIKRRQEKIDKKAPDILSGKEKAEQNIALKVKELINEIKNVMQETVQYIDKIKLELASSNSDLKDLIVKLGKGKAGLKAYKGFKEKIPKLFEKKM